MVEQPAKRYPRFFAAFILLMLAVAWISFKATKWFATASSATDPYVTAIFGWVMGALAIQILNSIAWRLDEREPFVARIERRLGGDA